MDKQTARSIVRKTLEKPFDKENFTYLIKNVLHNMSEEKSFAYTGSFIFHAFSDSVGKLERIGKYEDHTGRTVDVLIVHLKKETSLERARTMQRNYIAKYLNGSRDGQLKDAALVAFVAPTGKDWRFSFVKMDYRFNEEGKIKEDLTPARRFSFLVGEHENSHTAQSQLLPLLMDDKSEPDLGKLEDAFSIERVTKEFFEKYRNLFLHLKDSLDAIIEKYADAKGEFTAKNIDTGDFAKKLLGQIVFLYFLQKKGWFGVKRGEEWGAGSKRFLRELFDKKHSDYNNFFNDILEPLFYEALRAERGGVDDYYSQFDCRIPFLNGGLFDPIGDYDWVKTEILLPNELFSNSRETKEGDKGDGILDIFDRYNFTVKEDEPLEKEVAIDPEMLGKVFENLLEVKDRKSKGTYYTPREIVHYMCQESLIGYLATEIEGEVTREDIERLIRYGEAVVENESHVADIGRETGTYPSKLPESIRSSTAQIDEKLASIRVCDPAVGSGAFIVGMMNEIVKARGALTPYIQKNGERTAYDFKRHAIRECLYGVDIDASAVDIAKLRLWLSLVVDEEKRETIQPLPNLDYKIVQGNSLLSVEKNVFNHHLFKRLEELKSLYFIETGAGKKRDYKEEIDVLINEITDGYREFNFEVYFSEVFHEKKGFDVVIANPPYVDSETMVRTDPASRVKYSSLYKSAKGNWDIFVVFIERGMNLLKTAGTITYIVPNKLIAARYAAILRKMLLEKYVKEVRDFSRVNVFKEVSVYPVVFLIQNCGSGETVTMTLMKSLKEVGTQNIIPAEIFYRDTDWSRYFAPRKILNLILKISTFSRLSDYCNKISGAATVSEAYEIKKYVKEKITECQDRNIKKIVNTGTIDRYLLLWGKKRMQYIKSSYINPMIRDDDLLCISERRLKQAECKKIIIAGMTKALECAYDEGQYLAGKSTTIILDDKQNKLPLKVVLPLLNSSLISFWYRYFFSSLALAGGYLRISEREISQIPIPEISRAQQQSIFVYTDKILAITQSDDYLHNPVKQTQVREYERQIDELVYQLYGLTTEEIRLVEGEG